MMHAAEQLGATRINRTPPQRFAVTVLEVLSSQDPRVARLRVLAGDRPAFDAVVPTGTYEKGQRFIFTRERTNLDDGSLRGSLEPYVEQAAQKEVRDGTPQRSLLEAQEAVDPNGKEFIVTQDGVTQYVRINGQKYRIGNAREYRTIPGDRVAVSMEGTVARVESVTYISPVTIAGRINRQPGEQDGGFFFIARIPGSGTLQKVKLEPPQVSFLEAAANDNRVILIDRATGEVIPYTPPLGSSGREMNSERFELLVNSGTLLYGEAAQQLATQEAVQLKNMRKQWGITYDEADEKRYESWTLQQIEAELAARGIAYDPKKVRFWNAEAALEILITNDRKQIDDQVERAFSERARDLARAGEIVDRRDEPGRMTFAIDPSDVSDPVEQISHDDAISVKKISDDHYEIDIHVTDMTELVRTGTALDAVAQQRLTTRYIGGKPERMVPSLLSMHLGNLKEGRSRFAISVTCDARKGQDGVWQLTNMRLVRAATRVSHNVPYDAADKEIKEGTGEVADSLRALKMIADSIHGSEFSDMKKVISFYMRVYNSEAGSSFDSRRQEEKPRLRAVQDLVLGAYLKQAIIDPKAQEALEQELVRLGIVRPEQLGQDIDTVLKETHERIENGEFDIATTEEYYKALLSVRQEREQDERTYDQRHEQQGIAMTAYATSPGRKYPALVVQRSLSFIIRLEALANSQTEDITPEQQRALIMQYASEVLGMKISANDPLRALDDDAFRAEIQSRAKAHMARLLAYTTERDATIRTLEQSMAAQSTVRRIGFAIKDAKRAAKGRSAPEGRSAPKLPTEITMTIVDTRQIRAGAGEWMYGEARISRKVNSKLLDFVSKSVQRSGVVIGVKYQLPKGGKNPIAECREKGIVPCVVKLRGAIEDVETGKSRIVFRVSSK